MTGRVVPGLGEVLDDCRAAFGEYVVFPTPAALDAVVLWVAHTHVTDGFESTPRLHIASPEKQCGKTRTLEVAEMLVRSPLPAVNATVAALFRSIGDGQPPTVILDEVDTIFGPKAPDGSEDLRGLINAGHRRGKPMLRCVGPSHEVRAFATFAPMILAGIGAVPDTIEDRSITIKMRRRAPGESVRAFRHRDGEDELYPIRDRLAELAGAILVELDGWYPELPGGLVDRRADVWEPIIAVAALAGSAWVERARLAAITLHSSSDDQSGSLNVRLLADIKVMLAATTVVTTEDLLAGLHRLEESPWGEWDLTPRKLAARLTPFGIRSKNVRVGEKQAKGYEREQFADAWSRYLSVPASQPSQTSDQEECRIGSVPGTDLSVPASQPRASDQGRDGRTDGTDTWTGEPDPDFDTGLIGGAL
jgi:hypothetical protein